jgi:uncharacterized protein YndB with AHSA1/START domain
MGQNLIARATISIHANRSKVWEALVDPKAIKQYMFGTDVVTDWNEGSRIIWKGVWQGKAYEDKGKILEFKPQRRLQYSHFSPLSGQPDDPENYHTVTIDLSGEGQRTTVTLTQDNNPTEQARQHSEENWEMMLISMKKYLED